MTKSMKILVSLFGLVALLFLGVVWLSSTDSKPVNKDGFYQEKNMTIDKKENKSTASHKSLKNEKDSSEANRKAELNKDSQLSAKGDIPIPSSETVKSDVALEEDKKETPAIPTESPVKATSSLDLERFVQGD